MEFREEISDICTREQVECNPQDVKYGTYRVSKGVLVSAGYSNCNGIALLGNGWGALSHFDREHILPEQYTPRLIKNFQKKSKATDIRAVLIGGDPEHFETNRKILTAHSIPIVANHLDGWKDDDYTTCPTENYDMVKTIAVIPSLQQILIYAGEKKALHYEAKGW
ncbi:MAG: hypothetical protein ACMXYE_01580 [Candidatus Woesearchaeota archaeon]